MKKWKLVALAAGASVATLGGLAVSATASATEGTRSAVASSAIADFTTGFNQLCTYVGQNGTGSRATEASKALGCNI